MGWHGLAAKNQQINLSFFSYIAICFIWLEVCQFYEKKKYIWFVGSLLILTNPQAKEKLFVAFCTVV